MAMTALNHLAIIWVAVFISAYAAHKTRMTPVLFFLACGCALVNIGWVEIEAVSSRNSEAWAAGRLAWSA